MKMKDVFFHFWETGKSGERLASYRIFYGFLMVLNILILAPDFGSFFTESGIMSLQESRFWSAWIFWNLFKFDFITASNSQIITQGLLVLWMVSAFSIMLGYKFRLFAIINFILIVSFHHRNLLILHSGDILLRVMGFYLIFAPANRFWSLDSYYMKKANKIWPDFMFGEMWILRLMQIQMSFVYISTFFHKLTGDLWLNGTAVYYTSRLESFFRFDIPWIFDQIWLIKIMTWGTLIIEGALGVLVWIPVLRPWVLGAGVILHLGIETTMNIPMFQWIMMASYLLFIPEGTWGRLWSQIQQITQGKASKAL